MAYAFTDLAPLGAGEASTTRVSFADAPADSGRRPVGGQASIGLFGVLGYDYRAASAEAKAAAQQEAVVSEREAACRETASKLREFRQALGAKLAAAQEQEAPLPVEASPERQRFGIARAVAETPCDYKAARQAACEAVARRDREWQRALAEHYPAAPARHRAQAPPAS